MNQQLTVYERIAFLEEENRQLREILEDLANPVFDPLVAMDEPEHFTPMERKVLSLLFKHEGQFIQGDRILTVMYSCDNNPPQPQIIRVVISRIRKKLRKYTIITRTFDGYCLIELPVV